MGLPAQDQLLMTTSGDWRVPVWPVRFKDTRGLPVIPLIQGTAMWCPDGVLQRRESWYREYPCRRVRVWRWLRRLFNRLFVSTCLPDPPPKEDDPDGK